MWASSLSSVIFKSKVITGTLNIIEKVLFEPYKDFWHFYSLLVPMWIFVDNQMVSSHYQPYEVHFRTFSAKSNDRNLKYNRKGPFWAIFAQFGQNRNFPQKSDSITFEPLWTCNFMQFQKKILNGSPVISIWLIEWSDWPRASKPKNSGLKILLDMWMDVSDFLQYGAHFGTFSAKSNDRNFKYNWKGPFWAHFSPFWSKKNKNENFIKNPKTLLSYHFRPSTSCQISENNNKRFPRKGVTHGRTHGPEFTGSRRGTNGFF